MSDLRQPQVGEIAIALGTLENWFGEEITRLKKQCDHYKAKKLIQQIESFPWEAELKIGSINQLGMARCRVIHPECSGIQMLPVQCLAYLPSTAYIHSAKETLVVMGA